MIDDVAVFVTDIGPAKAASARGSIVRRVPPKGLLAKADADLGLGGELISHMAGRAPELTNAPQMSESQWHQFLEVRFPGRTWRRWWGKTAASLYSVVVFEGSPGAHPGTEPAARRPGARGDSPPGGAGTDASGRSRAGKDAAVAQQQIGARSSVRAEQELNARIDSALSRRERELRSRIEALWLRGQLGAYFILVLQIAIAVCAGPTRWMQRLAFWERVLRLATLAASSLALYALILVMFWAMAKARARRYRVPVSLRVLGPVELLRRLRAARAAGASAGMAGILRQVLSREIDAAARSLPEGYTPEDLTEALIEGLPRQLEAIGDRAEVLAAAQELEREADNPHQVQLSRLVQAILR